VKKGTEPFFDPCDRNGHIWPFFRVVSKKGSVPFFTALCLYLAAESFASPGGPTVGQALPDFALLDMHDQPVHPAALPEPVLVLNFFAFWCDTWVAELPQLRELATQQQALGFRLVSISIDATRREQSRLVCGGKPLPFPVLLDYDGRLSHALGVRRVPTIVVVDSRRRITWVREGFPGNIRILRAVREGPPTTPRSSPSGSPLRSG
jgi:peroxiredoxin